MNNEFEFALHEFVQMFSFFFTSAYSFSCLNLPSFLHSNPVCCCLLYRILNVVFFLCESRVVIMWLLNGSLGARPMIEKAWLSLNSNGSLGARPTIEKAWLSLNSNGSLGAKPVTGILVLEILVRQTKIFTGKYGPPLQELVRFEDARFTPSFLNRTQHDSSSTKGNLGNSQRTWRSPKLLQWQAESATLSF